MAAPASGWLVETDVDDADAYAAFATDRLWCGYAVADLEPPFRAYSRVAVARCGADVAACLVLRHPDFNSIVPHGPAAGLDAILERIELPAIGSIFTHPTARGRGLTGVVTGAVVAELLAGDCRDAILNVAQSNEPARRVYARLGFREHCPHFEGMASS